MLIKLFKYDIRSGAKKYFLMGAIVLSLILAELLASIINISILNSLIFSVSILASIGCFAVFAAISVMDVYSKFCGRESYLTYVVPAKTKEVVLSKIMALIVWGTFTILLIASFWLVYYFICPDESVRATIESLAKQVADMPGIIDVLISSLVLSFIFAMFQLVLCAGIANIPALKNRSFGIPGAVLSWVGLSQFLNIVLVVVWAVILMAGGGKLTNEYMNDPANINGVMNSLARVMQIGYAVFSVLSFFLSAYIIEKHRSI